MFKKIIKDPNTGEIIDPHQNELLICESQIIKKNDPRYNDLDHLCFLSKNLYNISLYDNRQEFFETSKKLSTFDKISMYTKKDQVDFRALPAKVARYTIALVDDNFSSFFALQKKKKDGKYNKPVRIPKYLHKTKGRQVVHYHKQALNFKEHGYIKLSKSTIKIQTAIPKEQVQYLRIVPCNTHIKIQIGYYKEKKQKSNRKRKRYASIDVGQNNLMTVTSNVFTPVIYNGKPVKSINQYYNKIVSKEKSRLKKRHNTYSSRKLQQLSLWRENQIDNYFHKTTKQLVDHLVSHNIDTVVIGRNKGWKDGISLSKKTNQNFVSIPFTKLYALLTYKLELAGITYIETEESHTSKCSFIDQEPIHHHEHYVGKRVRRGLFRSKDHYYVNADINGSLNILRKYLTKINDYSTNLHLSLMYYNRSPRLLPLING